MTEATRREPKPDERLFKFSSLPQFETSTNGSKQRKFSGVAYSGGVIPDHWYWGNVVFDMSTITLPDKKLPALIDHDRSQRCGYITAFSVNPTEGLTVAGNLLNNAAGQAVATESDDGFPWQMSVHIEPGSIEQVQPGTNITVNGQEFAGPLTVFRNSGIVEVSFTATGWDSNTSAAAMSKGGTTPTTPMGESAMDLKQAQDRIAALEAEVTTLQASKTDLTTQLTAANDKLTAFAKEVRDKDVTQLYADIKRDYKADDADVKAFAAMSPEAFTATAKVLREQFAKATPPAAPATQPTGLFGHTATGGRTDTSEAVDPLVADAKRRAEQFAKRAA